MPPASAPASKPNPERSIWRSSSQTVRPRRRRSSRPISPRRRRSLVSREHLARSGGVARAIIVNSGCANACTGEDGCGRARDGRRTARRSWLPRRAGAGRLDRRDWRGAADRQDSRRDCLRRSRALAPTTDRCRAQAIMTTDPFPERSGGTRRHRRPRRSRSAAWPRARE